MERTQMHNVSDGHPNQRRPHQLGLTREQALRELLKAQRAEGRAYHARDRQGYQGYTPRLVRAIERREAAQMEFVRINSQT
jgi:hypothetical protein